MRVSQQSFEVERVGMVIRGMTYRPEGAGRFPAVVFLHGITGQRMEHGFMIVHIARALARRGVASVTFDCLHSGESDGSFDQMLVSGEVADALRVTQWAQGQPFVDRARMGVAGFSLGGLVAACTVARTDAFGAMAMMAPTTVENLCRLERDDGEPACAGPLRLHERFFEDLRTLDPLGDCTVNPRPTLLVQGTGDGVVPPAVSEQYVTRMQAAKVPVRHELMAEADHVFGKPAHRPRLIELVSGFFAEQLAGRRLA